MFPGDWWGRVGATRAGAGRPWLACPLGCTPVDPVALEVENGRVDLTDESGEPTGTADCGPPDHPKPEMRRPASLAGSGWAAVVGQGGDRMDVEAFGDLDHDLLESMAFPGCPWRTRWR
jgi:hypothetical protein